MTNHAADARLSILNRRRTRLCALLMGLIFSACLTTPPAGAADAELIEAANKEGQVVWYTGLIEKEAARPMAAAFMARYPDIEVKMTRLSGEESARRIIGQAARGEAMADVFDSSTTVAALKPKGLIEPYRAPSAEDIPDDYKDPDGYWCSQVIYFTTLGYNSDLINAANVPTTYQALLAPAWRGKMGWSSSGLASGAGFVGNVLLTMGEDRGMAYLEQLKAQEIRRLPGGGNEALAAVGRGEVAIGLQIFNHHTVIQKKTGAPVAWVKLEPLLGFSNPIGLVRGAAHPNAGKLFIDFVLSEEGQTVLAHADHLPASRKVAAFDPALTRGFTYNFIKPEQVESSFQRWQAIAKKLFP